MGPRQAEGPPPQVGVPDRGAPGHLRATSGPPPGHLWTTSGPPLDNLRVTLGHLAVQGARAPGCTVPDVGSAKAGPESGGAQGPGTRDREPGLPVAAHRGSPQAGAASNGPAPPLQWHCGGRGARVTAGGSPKPRPSPDAPRRPAAPPAATSQLTFSFSAHLIPLWSRFAVY